MGETSRKIVVVGDGMVGKTALLSAFVKGSFQEFYIPTVFETSAKEIELADGRHIILGLWDTGGQEEFDQIRQLAYPESSLILLCYAIDCPTSLENIVHTWVNEVKFYCPYVPLILVGCKSDKRDPRIMVNNFVDPLEAENVCKQIGAQLVIECSAITMSNIFTVFNVAARIILDLERFNEKTFKLGDFLSLKRNKINLNGVNNRSLIRQNSDNKKNLSNRNYLCFTKRK